MYRDLYRPPRMDYVHLSTYAYLSVLWLRQVIWCHASTISLIGLYKSTFIEHGPLIWCKVNDCVWSLWVYKCRGHTDRHNRLLSWNVFIFSLYNFILYSHNFTYIPTKLSNGVICCFRWFVLLVYFGHLWLPFPMNLMVKWSCWCHLVLLLDFTCQFHGNMWD